MKTSTYRIAMKDKLKKALKKIAFDAAGIGACTVAAVIIPDFIPLLSGMEISIGVAAGIWAYIPVRKLINKIAKKS